MNERKQWFLGGLLSVLILLMFLGWVSPGQSQQKYPTRAIDILVPFAPGGSTDLVSRVTAAYLKKKWGVPVNVVNKPGGNTIPACLEVYRAKPDGYTVLADNNPSSSMLPIVVKDLPFKIMDRTFIATIASTPMVALVHAPSSIKNMKDLEAEAKRDPANFTWASGGGANTGDFMARQFLKAIDVDVTKTRPIMAQGGAQLVSLTAGGHILMGMGTVVASLPAVKGGLVRALALTGMRWPDMPDVRTTAEEGYPTVSVVYWVGISGPPKVPSYIIDIWDKTLQEMLKDKEFIAQLKNIGALPSYHNASATQKSVLKETEEVRELWGLK